MTKVEFMKILDSIEINEIKELTIKYTNYGADKNVEQLNYYAES